MKRCFWISTDPVWQQYGPQRAAFETKPKIESYGGFVSDSGMSRPLTEAVGALGISWPAPGKMKKISIRVSNAN